MSRLADELERLAQAATEAPWAGYSEPDVGLPYGLFHGTVMQTGFGPLEPLGAYDIDLIVALRNNLPAILTALRTADAEPGGDVVELESRADYSEQALADRSIGFLEARADEWMADTGVQRMFNAIASVFEKHAPQEIMDRFREQLGAIGHQCHVEGALRVWEEISTQQRAIGRPLPRSADELAALNATQPTSNETGHSVKAGGEVSTSVESDRPTDAEVPKVAEWLADWRRKCGTTPLSGKHYENAARTLLERLAPAAVRREALEEAAKIAETYWVAADYNTVGIADADKAMELCRQTAAAIRQHKDGGHG
ncbi:MAG: hypothetical protein EBS68_17245 [Rhodobacteraceae bacterium]|nr:hypothetical protein [Paracoccaceae bacterium]